MRSLLLSALGPAVRAPARALAAADALVTPLLDTATRMGETVLGTVGITGPAAGHGRERAVWTGPGRLHVPVHGVPVERLDALGGDLAAAVAALDGVTWAALDRGCGRLVVATGDDTPPSSDLVEAVIEAVGVVELEAGALGPFPALVAEHPADPRAVARHLTEAAADVVGGVAAGVGAVLRLPRIPLDPAPVVAFLRHEERLRGPLERRFGAPRVEVALAGAAAAAHGLEQHVLAPAVDLVHHLLLAGQDVSRAGAFSRAEPRLYPAPPALPEPVGPRRRPVPLPPGPVERYLEGDLVGTGVAALVAAPLSPRLADATRVLAAGVPKAAHLGREAFAVGVAQFLGSRDVLVVAPERLRLLDRVDRLVLDPAVFGGPDQARTDLVRRLAVAAETAGVDMVCPTPDEDHDAVVTGLQEAGHVVALVAGPDAPALASADLGLAVVPEPVAAVPWHADVVGTDAVAGVLALLAAMPAAREVSRHGVALAASGSAASLVALVAGPVLPLPRRRPRVPPSAGVDVAALVALFQGHLRGRGLRPVTVTRPRPAWHRLPGRAVLELLGSTAEHGLDERESARRRPVVEPPPSPPVRLAGLVVDEMRNPLTPVLAAGAVLSLAVGSVLDAAMVAAVVLGDAALGAIQQDRAQRAIAALDQAAAQEVRVRRGEREDLTTIADLVPGDVLLLAAGETVPADCRLLDAVRVEADESALTGESLPVTKSTAPTDAEAPGDQTSMLFAGTAVVAGTALAVVVATGEDTVAGRAAARGSAPRSGVEKRLEALASRVTPVAVGAGAVVVAADLLRGRPLADTLATGVSLAVAAVPEGLPILATAAQLAAGRRLSRRGVLVRNMRAIEALGRVDVLGVDKTGTLTEGRLAVAAVHHGTTTVAADDAGAGTGAHREVLATALAVAAATPAARRRPGSTDDAITRAATDLPAPPPPLAELPYESGRGHHAVVLPAVSTDDDPVLAAVGAPEVLLDRCGPHRRTRIGGQRRRALEATVEQLASAGGRVLGVAARRYPEPVSALTDDAVSGLDLVGFLVLADPPRADARDALDRIRRAGVRPVLITGDHPATGRWLAAELGIAEDGARVLTGPELDRLDDHALDTALTGVNVCARVTSAHKARLVLALRRAGHTVAMTGDGVNDAAAIRISDVGIALGGADTGAARRAADIVLVGDHVTRIVDSLLEGRALWVAVRDAVANLVGHNYGEIAVIAGASLLTGSSPLTARQLLLVNLFTDTVPALSIAMRPPPDLDPAALLAEGPDRSFGPELTDAIVARGVATGMAGTAGYVAGRLTGTLARARTMTLLAIVGAQLGQTALARPTDPVVVGAAAASALLLVAIVETPGVSGLFGCRPLGPVGLGIAGAAAAGGTAATAVLPPVVRRVRSRWAPAPTVPLPPSPAPDGVPDGAADGVVDGLPDRHLVVTSNGGGPSAPVAATTP